MPYPLRGYIRAADALQRIIEASGTPPMALHDALRRLREALAEGDLTAWLLARGGDLWPVDDVKPWRTNHGLDALRFGRLLWRTGVLENIDVEGGVWLDAAAIEAWLNPPAATSAAPAQAATARVALAVPAQPMKAPFDESLFRGDYRARVGRWQAAQRHEPRLLPPTPKQDAAWAAARFDGVPRGKLRAARRELAPPEWKRQGKRPHGVPWRD